MTTTATSPSAASGPAAPLQATPAAATRTATAQPTGDTTPDFNRFLTLLTAQLKYQDPMSPTDPTAFVAQLAQFSQVEQQTRTNTLLQQMTAAMSGNGLSQTAALIGRQVKATASSLTVPASGATAPVRLEVSQPNLKNLRLVVTDQTGVALRALPVATGQSSVSFDGRLANGQRLAAGSYGVKLVGDDGTGREQTAGGITTQGQVVEVRTQPNGDHALILADGSQIEASKVTSLAK